MLKKLFSLVNRPLPGWLTLLLIFSGSVALATAPVFYSGQAQFGPNGFIGMGGTDKTPSSNPSPAIYNAGGSGIGINVGYGTGNTLSVNACSNSGCSATSSLLSLGAVGATFGGGLAAAGLTSGFNYFGTTDESGALSATNPMIYNLGGHSIDFNIPYGSYDFVFSQCVSGCGSTGPLMVVSGSTGINFEGNALTQAASINGGYPASCVTYSSGLCASTYHIVAGTVTGVTSGTCDAGTLCSMTGNSVTFSGGTAPFTSTSTYSCATASTNTSVLVQVVPSSATVVDFIPFNATGSNISSSTNIVMNYSCSGT